MADVPDTGEFKLALSTSHLLHRAQQLASDRFAFLVGENESAVTLRQFAVLAAIAEAPGLSQTELVRATGVDRSTLADMMNRMESRSWIVRTARDSDARAKAVRLADEGMRVLRAARQHAKAADAAILDALAKPRRKTFHATLMRLAELADQSAAAMEKSQRKSAKDAKEKSRKTREREVARQRKRRRREARADVAPAPRKRIADPLSNT